MTWEQANYDQVKADMKSGDVIAFAGRDGVSEWIKSATAGPVSHVGVVLRADQAHASPQVVEATPDLGEHYGVSVRSLDERIANYQGDIWWLPLSDAVRSRLDVERFTAFLLEKEDVPFDVHQAIQSASDELDHVPVLGEWTHNVEDFSAFFCSELVSAGLEAGGAIPSLNCSEVTPLDLLRFAIYGGTYYQLKGAETQIPGYNMLDPAGWGTGTVAERQASEIRGPRRIEPIYWTGVFLWAALVFGADTLGLLPQVGSASAQIDGPSAQIDGASAWSWVFAGAGLLALIGDLYRVSTPDWPDPAAWDYIWAGVLLIIGLGGFVNLEIAFPLILACAGIILLANQFVRRD